MGATAMGLPMTGCARMVAGGTGNLIRGTGNYLGGSGNRPTVWRGFKCGGSQSPLSADIRGRELSDLSRSRHPHPSRQCRLKRTIQGRTTLAELRQEWTRPFRSAGRSEVELALKLGTPSIQHTLSEATRSSSMDSRGQGFDSPPLHQPLSSEPTAPVWCRKSGAFPAALVVGPVISAVERRADPRNSP